MLQLLRRAPRAARAAFPRCLEHAKTRRLALPFSPRPWAEASRRAFSDHVSPADQSAASAPLEAPEGASPRPAQEHQQQITRRLPVVCPGCGAHSQMVEPDAAGFYSEKRSKRHAAKSRMEEEDRILNEAFESSAVEDLPDTTAESPSAVTQDEVPVCARCHKLHHYRTGNSIIHPSMQSIQSIIEESPHKHNHIYHVVDAADFPLSLIPNLQDALQLPKLRTQNRRSKSLHYIRGRVAEVSFIITRSDLLAPKKEQVDTLMPYLQDCLRDALGRSGKKLRLGNVRCVSAQRGWWTKNVKEDIWKRGGAGWMVGKVNVGKSALFEAVFPKGRNQEVSPDKLRREEQTSAAANYADRLDVGINDALGDEMPPTTLEQEQDKRPEQYQESKLETNEPRENDNEDDDVLLDEDSLLPPVQPLTAYPRMPLISSLPGTTASPIRIPFGSGSKGELIDLPGIARSSLETHVQPEHHSDLIMHSRVVPEQQTLKPSQSLLLGGLIRITPKTPDQIFLAYAFTPTALSPHTTATDKAIAIQTGVHPETQDPYTGTVSTVATDATKENVASAGTFKLAWDVTKRRAGPLTRLDAGKQKTENLPFRVYSADILIEGVGWVELVAQVRKKRVEAAESASQDPFRETEADDATPEVEIFSPKGKYVGIRRPMNAWLLGGPKKDGKRTKGRGRMSIAFEKRKAGGKLGRRFKEMAE